MEAVISSTIYLACREEGYPRTMKEMCAVGTVTKKDLGKVFKTVPFKNKKNKKSRGHGGQTVHGVMHPFFHFIFEKND